MIDNKDRKIEVILGLIAQRAFERGSLLTKTRLVKFLYLLDLYCAQSERETFTGWPWAFVHYGPYCRESTDSIDHAEASGYLVAKSYESKFRDEDFRLYGPGEQLRAEELDAARGDLPIYVSSNLLANVQEWCDDTFGLLDHIYFHTGPMKRAMPGERLSFDGEEKIDYAQFQPVRMVPLSRTKKKALRDVIEKMKAERIENPVDASLYDDAYFDFISTVAGEETPVGLAGIAKLKVDQTRDD